MYQDMIDSVVLPHRLQVVGFLTQNDWFYIELKSGELFPVFELVESLQEGEFSSICKMIKEKLLSDLTKMSETGCEVYYRCPTCCADSGSPCSDFDGEVGHEIDGYVHTERAKHYAEMIDGLGMYCLYFCSVDRYENFNKDVVCASKSVESLESIVDYENTENDESYPMYFITIPCDSPSAFYYIEKIKVV